VHFQGELMRTIEELKVELMQTLDECIQLEKKESEAPNDRESLAVKAQKEVLALRLIELMNNELVPAIRKA